MKIENILSQDQKNKIEQKIIEIEKQTSAEVVPMIVTASTPVGHVKVVLFLLLFLFSDFVIQALNQDSWSQNKNWELGASFLICAGLALVLSKIHFIQRILTSDLDEVMQVNRRALLEFYDQGLHAKPNRNLVLFLFSLMEKRIVVLTSPELNKVFSTEDLNLIISEFAVQNKKEDFYQGLLSALEKTGTILKEKLPVNKNEIKKDEASNKIIIKN